MKPTILCAAAALTAAGVAAQSFDKNLGSLMSHPTNDSVVTQPLSFTFTFPGGSTATALDVDANGLIRPGGDTAGVSDFTATEQEFRAAPMIAPLWADLGTWQSAPGDVWFNEVTDGLGTRAILTWCDTRPFTGVFPYHFTMQCQLWDNGTIDFCYDNRLFAIGQTSSFASRAVLAGVSDGSNAPVGEVDLTDPTLVSGPGIIHEFYFTNDNTCDLRSLGIRFSPDGVGGFNIARQDDPGITPCNSERYGRPCGVTFTFIDAGFDIYSFYRDKLQWIDDGGTVDDPNPGTVTGNNEWANGNGGGGTLGDDSNTAPIPIGFDFTFPGGTTVSSIVIDNNGRIMSDGSDPGDFNPSVAEFLNGPSTIAAWWTDLSAQRGSLRTRQEPGMFIITWEDVPKFAENEVHSFQIVLMDGGDNDSFNINYRDVQWWQAATGATSDDVLVGCSPGAAHPAPTGSTTGGQTYGADGSLNLSTPSEFALTDPAIYEFWDANAGGSVQTGPDIHTKLLPVGNPLINGTLDFQITGISTGTSILRLFIGLDSLPEPFADLTPLGIGLDDCNFYINLFINDLDLSGAYTPGSDTFSLSTPIPNDSGLDGLSFVLQAVGVDFTGVPQCGTAGLQCVTLTNALRLTFRP